MPSCCEFNVSCCHENSTKASQRIALVGNPNCGKTTLFNALTGARQHVGNWSGVTVECMSGHFAEAGKTVEIIDLPGAYSLTLPSDASASMGSMDECIACDFILAQTVDVIVNIVDASNLERHLYLTTQLLEMGAPVMLALNMMDVARARKVKIDLKALSQKLGCPVIPLEAHTGNGLTELKQAIIHYQKSIVTQRIAMPYPSVMQEVLNDFSKQGYAAYFAVRLLEEDARARAQVGSNVLEEVARQQEHIKQALQEDADILIADTRYRFIQQVLENCVSRSINTDITWTSRIDRIVLNRVLGIPIFLSVMYLLFVFAINVGGFFQDFFNSASQTIFVEWFASGLNALHAPTWLTALLANGVGKGMNTVITFVPVIGAMFLFLALLEDSGYMARAAFVVDRCMRALGLPGKAFVPMIVGFGCNVPAVMAARTLEHKRDRILTIMMSPFMSCGARLAIYAVFTAAFFPRGGQNVVFMLYLIGILMAVFTGFLLQKTLLKGDPALLIMELPAYHLPHMQTLLLHAWQRLKGFVFRAGKLIVPICVLIGALNTLNVDGTLNSGNGDTHSILSIVGQWVTPVFAPMGIHADNWPATVGLVTGILAKEVVVGTLNTLYTQMGHFTGEAGVYGLMYQKFDGQIGAFAYLLFILLYFPCVSTMAVMLRELHRGWTIFSACWMMGVAYGTAVAFYQIATWSQHPLTASIWVVTIFGAFFITIVTMRWIAKGEKPLKGLINVMPIGESS
jgi:ferrous iron transport protein B